MKIFMKKFISLALLAGFVVGLSACNTIHGVGKDVEKVGDEIQEKSD